MVDVVPPSEQLNLVVAVSGQKGGFGEPHIYDLVLSDRGLYAVPLQQRMTAKEIAKAGVRNWVAPGVGSIVHQQNLAEHLQQTLPQRCALYAQGHAARLAKENSTGLVVAWDQVKKIRLIGMITKNIELLFPDGTYYFRALDGRTEEVFGRVRTLLDQVRK